jgi:hypothetical protein
MIPPMRRKDGPTGAPRVFLAGALIACLVIHPAAGAVTWLHFEKAAVRKEVAERIRRGVDGRDLVVLEFPLEKTRTLLRWEGPREFEYRGRMYDVVETRLVGDTVAYKCLRDDEETLLNSRLKELAPQESGEVLDPEGDDERPDPRPMTSHGAVVCDWRISDTGLHRLRHPSRTWPPSVALKPPTPPPKPA